MKLKVEYLLGLVHQNTREAIDQVISHIDDKMTIPESKMIDFALDQVTTPSGIASIEYHLFNGSQIQRNYCTLYFNRRGIWQPVKRAFEQGLIDEIQAFAK